MIMIVALSGLAGIVAAGAVYYGWSLAENLLAMRGARRVSAPEDAGP
jgi:hypothetical protein